MNISDEVTVATMHVVTRAAESGMHLLDRTVDLIAKLLKMLAENERNRKNQSREKPVKSVDLTDLKPGEVKIRDLIADAKKNGDTMSASEQGLTQSDKKIILKKAKEYGIPVAFTGSEQKDNLYANVRTSDLPIFQRICTDMLKDKIAERPQELGNFKVQKWEMPCIISELNKHDLSAQFGKTKQGEYFCLYEKADEKAIHIARNEFVRKCDELNQEITFDRDEKGYFTLKDTRSGKEISFDKVPTKEELASQIHEKFGYDENKCNIACAKFGEECLKGQEKQQFFSDNPQKEFSKIDANIKVEGESIYAKEFSCWHMIPKTDHIPRIVFQSNENGKFAVLNPEKMTRKQMGVVFREQLGLKDEKQINALIDKTEKVSDYYVREENSSLDYQFTKDDFDMSNPDIVSEMRRTDEDGNVFTKSVPVSAVSNAIERTDKDNFAVEITISKTETDQNHKEHTSSDTQVLQLSFSDKKDSLFQMTQLYRRQGVPEHIAKKMAKDVFRMAEMQNPEKVVLIEEVKEKSVVFSHHDRKTTIDISKPEKAVTEISDKFEISMAQAEQLMEKVNEKFEIAKELSNLSGMENKAVADMRSKLPERNTMQNQPSFSQEPNPQYMQNQPPFPQEPVSPHMQNQPPFPQEPVPPHMQNQPPFPQEPVPPYMQNQPPFPQEPVPPEAYSIDVPEEPDWVKQQYDNAPIPEEPDWIKEQYDNAPFPEDYNSQYMPNQPPFPEYVPDVPQNMPVPPPSPMGGRR